MSRLSEAQARRLATLYTNAERDILKKINRALMKGNQTEYLEAMHDNVAEILDQLRAGSREWCQTAIPRVYVDGVENADDMLEGAGLEAGWGFGAIHQQAAQILAENTYQRLYEVTQVVGRQVEDIYREMALERIRGSVIGYDTWQQVARGMRDRLADQGVTGFRDRAGREWNMAAYTRMVARTSTMESHLEGTKNRLLEQGHDLVVVSRHAGACPLCLPWEGEVLSLTGKTDGYPTLEEAEADGLFHPNCRHTYSLYIELEKEIAEMEADQAAIPGSPEEILGVVDRMGDVDQGLQGLDMEEEFREIWREPVTLADYKSKRHAIQAKKDYFSKQIVHISPDDMSMMERINKDRLDRVIEYERKGEQYLTLTGEQSSLEEQLRKLLGIKEDPYSQARKDAAYWFEDAGDADNLLREDTGRMWRRMTPRQRRGIYEYTAGSGKFNRPLRGYAHSWNNYVGVGKVPHDTEGGKKYIAGATSALKKCSYDFDIWLNRGISGTDNLGSFLGISEQDLINKTEEELQDTLVGKVVKDHAFLSTSPQKGKGFGGHIINLYAPKGTRMIYAEPFSYYGRGAQSPNWDGWSEQSSFSREFEIIVNRGYEYKITKVEKGPGKFYIDVDIVLKKGEGEVG